MGRFGVRMVGASMRDIAAIARVYDGAGFESVWVPDHIAFPDEMPTNYPYRSEGMLPFETDVALYDPWIWLSYVAACTTKINLACGVYIQPLRHPLALARDLVTLDRLSSGRVILGAGVGWLEDEFRWLGETFQNRGRRMDASIDALQALWTEDVVTVENEFYNFGPLRFNPKPLQRSIPIEIGGRSEAALTRAAVRGDGWIEVGSRTIDAFRETVADIHQRRANAGRSGPFQVTVSDRQLMKSASYGELFNAGATRLIIDPPRTPSGRIEPQAVEHWAQHFADNVIRRFSST